MWKWFSFFTACFSESVKGSDSEDDFLRQKTKAKATSDSDSDSDIGTKKSKKKTIFLRWNNPVLNTCISKLLVIELRVADVGACRHYLILFYSKGISGSGRSVRGGWRHLFRQWCRKASDPRPAPGICLTSPSLPLLSSTHPQAFLIVPSPFLQESLNLFFSEPLAKLLWANPYYQGSLNHTAISEKVCVCVCL